MDSITLIFSLAILLMSVVIHEVAHGYAALFLGDPTAKYEGRLTLNPIKHMDPIGSFLVPLFSYIVGGFVFGWARPVPFNPYNLKSQRWGELIVAIAGPASNFVIALVFSLILNLFHASLGQAAVSLMVAAVIVNVSLMVFNLMPIAPLDGSKVLFAFIPYTYRNVRVWMERYSLFLFLAFILFFSDYLQPVVLYIVGHLLRF